MGRKRFSVTELLRPFLDDSVVRAAPLMRMLRQISDSLISLFYPQPCDICGQVIETMADGAACHACWNQTKLFSETDILCVKCGVFLSESDQPLETLCRRCDDDHYDSARAVGPYKDALAATIISLKGSPSFGKTASGHLSEAFRRSPFQNSDLIVPVPLSRKRLHSRGFNQATILARIIRNVAGIPVDEYSFVRTIDTPMHRAAMDQKAREQTVKNAFAVTRPNLISGKRILLIDDVLTSGATSSNCALELKKAGAESVNVLTLARALLSHF